MIEDISITEDQRAFAEAAKRCFAACVGLPAGEVATRLATDGLLGLLVEEELGGAGLGASAAVPVLGAAGAALLAYPLAEAMAAVWFLARGGAEDWQRAMDGSLLVSVAWQGRILASGSDREPRLTGIAARVACGDIAHQLLICTPEAVFGIDLGAPGVTIAPAGELDLERHHADVIMEDVSAVRLGYRTEAAELCQIGMLLRSADMLGAAQAAFATACDHAATRCQFGKPLSGQQIVANDLARDHFLLECVQVSVAYAAVAWDTNKGDFQDSCAIATALAAEHLPRIAEDGIQIHGAMGITWEMPLHRWLRRIRTAAGHSPVSRCRQALGSRLIERWTESAT